MEPKRILNAYNCFCHLIVDEKLYLNPRLSFPTLCQWIGIGEKELNNELLRELGYTGPAMLQHFREQTQTHLREYYGIDLCLSEG